MLLVLLVLNGFNGFRCIKSGYKGGCKSALKTFLSSSPAVLTSKEGF